MANQESSAAYSVDEILDVLQSRNYMDTAARDVARYSLEAASRAEVTPNLPITPGLLLEIQGAGIEGTFVGDTNEEVDAYFARIEPSNDMPVHSIWELELKIHSVRHGTIAAINETHPNDSESRRRPYYYHNRLASGVEGLYGGLAPSDGRPTIERHILVRAAREAATPNVLPVVSVTGISRLSGKEIPGLTPTYVFQKFYATPGLVVPTQLPIPRELMH